METIKTVWEVWTYDIGGNANDGWEVNDRCCIARELKLDAIVHVNNAGTLHEFKSAELSEKSIRKAFGDSFRVAIDIDRADIYYYANIRLNGKPYGELRCLSHESLFPIKPHLRNQNRLLQSKD